MTTDALVLAGGGVAGIAWETGVLMGIADVDPTLLDAIVADSTSLIGTSAGATVAGQLAAGRPIADLFAAQVSDESAELKVDLDLEKFGAMMADGAAADEAPEATRRRIGAIARQAETPSVSARRAVIAARLAGADWPERPLLITAIDTETGELRVFDRTSDVGLVDAIAASSAVPGIWPTVEIAGRHYMDGGMRTVANADLAKGADRVLILVPSLEQSPFGQAIPDAELEALSPARVMTVFADADSIAAMGTNPLDPASRPPSAIAGRERGRRVAADVAAFWR
ncbi:patatin-like phospholipase family protein [Diaminobutyricibacter sp. McL0618]|uniref:patatin-like phospholipase family protein n=1 Tax=Leifsonia sp. McL0618 TaxID=3415677 RepID=UPI003CF1618E